MTPDSPLGSAVLCGITLPVTGLRLVSRGVRIEFTVTGPGRGIL